MRTRPSPPPEGSLRHALLLAVSLATLAGGCSGNGGPILTVDAGVDAGEDGGPPVDAFVDRERPRIVATSPAGGATDVDTGTPITFTFSEAMQEGGAVTVEADGAPVPVGAAMLDAAGTTLALHLSAMLPGQARVRVTLDESFADLAGNTIGLPYTLVFDTGDDAAPVVIETTPSPGASDVSARLDEVTLRFDEAMDASTGALRIEGGAASVGALEWLDGRTVRAPLTGLADETSYVLVPEGFEDAAGRALDTASYLVDGAIPFTTGADRDGPRVVDSVPAEGQVNVSIRTGSIVVELDEPMDTSIASAALTIGTSSTTLSGTWSADAREISFLLGGALALDVAHRLDLTSLRDVAGNPLDAVVYLGDGSLDFETGADATSPVVLYTDPVEGTTGVPSARSSIVIVFDQAMETRATLRVDDGAAPFDAPATWNAAGTQARLDVAGRLASARAYRVELASLRSARGLPLHGPTYLGDGVLDFTTATPTGEQCRDELTVAEATPTGTGGHQWTLAPDAVSIANGSGSCVVDGTSPDAVIRYRKASAAASAGGRYLRVRVQSASARPITMDIYQGVCAPADAARASARLACPWPRTSWETTLDVGAGDYYLWVATEGGRNLFEGATVTIEEIDAAPEGDSCAAPFTTASAVHTVSAGGEHVWTVPAGAVHGAEMAIEPGAPGNMTCDADGEQGADAVVEIVKSSDDSVITLIAEPVAGSSTADAINVQLLDGCDPRSAGSDSLGCVQGRFATPLSSGLGPKAFDIRGPAGRYYVWVAVSHPWIAETRAFPGFVLRAREVTPGPGESCETAIPIGATGTTAIAPASTASVGAPSCVTPGTNVTWYRFTATENASLVTTTGTGAIAAFRAPSGGEASCTTDAVTAPLAAFVRAGSDVCVAVAAGTSISALSVEPVPYAGNMGVATDLHVEAPLDADGEPVSMTLETWLAVTPSTLYMSVFDGVLAFPRTGGGGIHYPLPGDQLGNAGLAIGESVFALDNSTTAGTATRLWRLIGPTGAFGPIAWDAGYAYPDDSFLSLFHDGSELWIANDVRWLGTSTLVPITFSRVPASSPAMPAPVATVTQLGETYATAVDQTWIYVLARLGIGSAAPHGVYRIERATLGTASVRIERIAPVTSSATRGSIVIDSTVLANHLYWRDNQGNVRVIVGAGGATPRHLGILSALGDTDDVQLAGDPGGTSLFLFESETDPSGRIVRLD